MSFGLFLRILWSTFVSRYSSLSLALVNANLPFLLAARITSAILASLVDFNKWNLAKEGFLLARFGARYISIGA